MAWTKIVPAPVTVKVLPLTVPGPARTVKTTGLEEPPPLALRMIGLTPNVTALSASKVIASSALLTVSVC